MNVIYAASLAVLAAVFAVSGGAKLADRAGTRTAVREFGVPSALVTVVAGTLPLLELVSVAGLLHRRTAEPAAAVLLLLLVCFSIAIAFNLLRGQRVDCHCFGALSRKPLSWRLLVRNAGLAGLAMVVLLAPASWGGLGVFDEIRALEPVLRGLVVVCVLLTAAVASLGAAGAALLGRYGSLLIRIDALEASALRASIAEGQAAPTTASVGRLSGRDLDGQAAELPAESPDGRPRLLLFVRPGCGPCAAMLPAVSGWLDQLDGLAHVLVISSGDMAANRRKFADSPDVPVLVEEDGAFADRLGVDATPAAVLISAAGHLIAGPSFGQVDIEKLVYATAGLPPPAAVEDDDATPLQAGDPLPDDIELSEGGGRSILIGDKIHRDGSVILLWDPTCSFAQRIEDDVRKWAASPARPHLVVVSRRPLAGPSFGDEVLLDSSFTLGSALGVPGTPSATAAARGSLVAPSAVGGPEVLQLLAAASAGEFPGLGDNRQAKHVPSS